MTLRNYLPMFKKKQRSDAELIFEKGGHKFYVFSDPAKMPAQRVEALYYKMEEIKLGIRKVDLQAFHDMMKSYIDAGELQNIATLNSYLGVLLDHQVNLKPALSLATVVVLVDDEPAGELSEPHDAIKQRMIDKYPEVKDFFCELSANLVKSFNKEMNASEYLAALSNPHQRQIEKLFLDQITTTSGI